MTITEIVLGDTRETKRDAIQKNLGQKVILNDHHNGWCHGFLLTKGYSDEIYKIKIFDSQRKTELHYHDLKQLLVIY